MSIIIERYSSAVRSSNLLVKEATTYSDSDVLGAAGLAGKRNALAMSLTRLFAGDNHASLDLVRVMSELVWGKAQAKQSKLKRVQADDMARAVLAWHRDGGCKVCGGHGFQLIPGTRTVGENACPKCDFGKVPFDTQFPDQHVYLARWLLAEVQREQAKAGPAAMSKLSEQMNL